MMVNPATLRGVLLISLCLLVFGFAGCDRKTDSRSSPFPATDEIAGWTRIGDIRTFSAADLWKYIDGEAERYRRAGVQTASTADYKFRGKFDAVIDIYTMGSGSGAEKIVESEPAANSRSARLGDDSRLYSQSLVFRSGVYLVRITAYDESAEIQPALLALARGIESRLTQ